MEVKLRLQILAWFESNGFAFRNCHLSSSSRVASDASFSRFDDEHSETTKFDSFAASHGVFHRFKKSFDGDFSFLLRDAGFIRDIVNDVQLDQWCSPASLKTISFNWQI